MPVKASESGIIESVVSFYPDLKPRIAPTYNDAIGNPCSFALFTDDLRFVYGPKADICHSSVADTRKLSDQLITSLPYKTDCDMHFITMLLKFPFRQWSDHISIEMTGSGEFYLRVRNIQQIPPQVLYNLAIATRTPLEHGHYFFKRWTTLAQAGVNPMLAFILSTHNLKGTRKKDPLEWTFDSCEGENWHFFLDPTNNWESIIEGTVKLHDYDRCTPCNSIWGSYDYLFFESLEGLTIQQICDKLGYPVDPNPTFPSYKGKTYAR